MKSRKILYLEASTLWLDGTKQFLEHEKALCSSYASKSMKKITKSEMKAEVLEITVRS